MPASPLSASAYEILGVTVDATPDAVRRAYRLRLRETHPDTGGDSALFIRVQQAWELIGDAEARAAYDRATGLGAPEEPVVVRHEAAASTRPRARSYGQPGGWRRERYLVLAREWAGRGVELPDPYAAAFVRSAPRELRRMLADALAEEETARIVSGLGMGYTVWHDVAADAVDPEDKLDHVVLGPSGLYGLLSEDYGEPVGFRRGEITGPHVDGAPVTQLVSRVRAVARAARVRFSGAIVVLPDDHLADAVTEFGTVRGIRVAVSSRSGLGTVLRRGLVGAREMGGTELFDVRTRLQQAVRFV
ncbi:J domain-containing protein [Microbacterium sp. X-17]|uniref:J domain-containing protein n=1 Tax=Microbacterium sp. X-17 TaxID=3144404 RepID=UPI0031F4D6E2